VRTLADLLADSFAFIALFEDNERYRRLFSRGGIVTTAMNVLEIYGNLLRRYGREEALGFASPVLPMVVDVPPETALPAAEFRLRMSKEGRPCSHIDAWGWAAAKALGRKFLTGDPAFKGVDNVEFVR